MGREEGKEEVLGYVEVGIGRKESCFGRNNKIKEGTTARYIDRKGERKAAKKKTYSEEEKGGGGNKGKMEK